MGTLVGGIGDIAGGVLSNYLNNRESKKQRKWSAKEAQKNRDFQETMSSTAVQRRAKDLRKAGFNRLLSVATPGASTPGGATAAQYQRTQSQNLGQSLSRGISSAAGARLQKIQAENAQKTGLLISRQDALVGEQAIHERRKTEKTLTETKLLANLIPGSNEERKIDESVAGEVLRWTNRLTNSALGAVRTGLTGTPTGRK